MFTRLLNVIWCSYILDNAHLSSGIYFIRLSGPYFLMMGYYIFTPLFFKLINLNNFPSLSDCHSLSLPITVKRFPVLITTGYFPTSLVYIVIQG